MEVPETNAAKTGKGFRSPVRVLATFFRNSRDRWKAKYQHLQQRIKAFRTETRDLRRSRDQWRRRAEESEAKLRGLQREPQALTISCPPLPPPAPSRPPPPRR